VRNVSVAFPLKRHSVHNLSSSLLLSKNVKIEIHGTIILPAVVVQLGITLGEEHEAEGVLEQDAKLNYIFGRERDEVRGGWRKLRT
jgi:hypothetical protein